MRGGFMGERGKFRQLGGEGRYSDGDGGAVGVFAVGLTKAS